MGSFTNKNFLVVGGSTGIGLECARLLAEDGAQVISWSRTGSNEAITRVSDISGVDVTQSVEEAAATLPDSIHGLIYAPGSIPLGAFARLSPEVFLETYDLNVVGAVRVIQAIQARLLAAEGSAIVLFSTVAAGRGMQFHTSIGAAKAALEGFARSYAAEFAAKQVRCNVVAPSLTDTPLAERLLSNEKKQEAAAARHPLARVGTVGDIARAALFLADPLNDWITGQILHVDGGLDALSGL